MVASIYLLLFMASSFRSTSRTGLERKKKMSKPEPISETSLNNSLSKLRRAAGSQSLHQLKQALNGWSTDEIDSASDRDGGKGPLHIAAWQGCLDNVVYLVENMGCDINRIATGEYCYGKTPIFFALTRSREEVIEYLLDKGATVKIVNNKGQSVLSIAASHISAELIDRIRKEEVDQAEIQWQNYRATHSDQLEYGDLDPRFLDRPLRDTDLLTPLVVNPTTKQTRRGGFLRRNPLVVPSAKSNKNSIRLDNSSIRKSIKVCPNGISSGENATLAESWERLQKVLETENDDVDNFQQLSIPCLQTILRISDKRREPWISEAVSKMTQMNLSQSKLLEFLQKAGELSQDREKVLVDKLIFKVNHPMNHQTMSHMTPISKHRSFAFLRDIKEWNLVCEVVRCFFFKELETVHTNYLVLPQRPVLVDSIQRFPMIDVFIRDQPLFAIDTEWGDDGNLATLQVVPIKSIERFVVN
jgi:Ankyrin repeats (many copies)